jgi:hypothetical protein
MIEGDWRVAFIDYIQEHKQPPLASIQKALKLLASYDAVKGTFQLGVTYTSMDQHQAKCVSMEEDKEILQEIHEGVCGNHAASRTLVDKVFRSSFYWPTILVDAKAFVHRCTNC